MCLFNSTERKKVTGSIFVCDGRNRKGREFVGDVIIWKAVSSKDLETETNINYLYFDAVVISCDNVCFHVVKPHSLTWRWDSFDLYGGCNKISMHFKAVHKIKRVEMEKPNLSHIWVTCIEWHMSLVSFSNIWNRGLKWHFIHRTIEIVDLLHFKSWTRSYSQFKNRSSELVPMKPLIHLNSYNVEMQIQLKSLA